MAKWYGWGCHTAHWEIVYADKFEFRRHDTRLPQFECRLPPCTPLSVQLTVDHPAGGGEEGFIHALAVDAARSRCVLSSCLGFLSWTVRVWSLCNFESDNLKRPGRTHDSGVRGRSVNTSFASHQPSSRPFELSYQSTSRVTLETLRPASTFGLIRCDVYAVVIDDL